jgi:ferredoxin
MPWVNKEMCTGCEVCVDECPVGAISLDEDAAFINESECIRCGVCHDVCPEDAVRHDGERIPEEVESNLAWVRQLLDNEYFSNDKERQRELIGRMERYFKKNKKVAEATIERLHEL